MSDAIVITGAGMACHLGDDASDIELALRDGRVRPYVRFEEAAAVGAGCELIGRYDGDVSDDALGIDRSLSRVMGRASRLALRAARAALAQAAIDPSDIGVIVGSGTGDVETHVAIREHLAKHGRSRGIGPYTTPRIMSSGVSASLATVLRARGPSFSVAAACAGGAVNIAMATQLIEQGLCDAALAGGVEVADLHFHLGFDEMRAYNRKDNGAPERASRPYAKDRAGFVFGEGAGAVVLERERSAKARGAPILGRVLGFGLASDGEGDMVKPSKGGPLRAMQQALSRAGVSARSIDYVNTHATGTAGDVIEVAALRELFGGRHVPYSSTKGYTGHTISAAGALEAIFTLAMLQGGWIAPCPNADPVDPELESYPPVTRPTTCELKIALSNSFGFGGTNAALVLAR
ncbi:MAG: beta-ketoacyl-[acyl-carrier-protein] synthase family protein [Sandaracinaceae bacterium]|nr:beta-ketoacyl-[acyl-carrier-protein] synthase family protein [Sandaracinaceae bacterium]